MAFVYSAQSMARRWVRAESPIIIYGGGSMGFRRSRITAIKRKGEREIENTRRNGFPVAQLQTAVSSETREDRPPSLVTDDKDFASEERLWDLYKRWHSHYGISWDLEEDLKRFNTFKESAEYVHSYNKKGGQHQLGLNQFADMTNEEFMSSHCLGIRHRSMRRGSLHGTGNFPHEKMTGVPPALDWREKGAVTEVKDQGEYCEKM